MLSIRRIYYKLLKYKKQSYINSLINKGLRLGENVEIIADFFFDPSHCYLISIGNNSTICPNVRLIAHDASTKTFLGYTKLGKINIKENCFIGDSSIILPGVTIGPNSIVGAGAIVTKDVPEGKIATGNPARVIATLEDYINKIKELSKDKKIFNEDYLIGNLDVKKRNELVHYIGNEMGFII